MIPTAEAELFEVFTTKSGIIYQSDRQNCLFLDFGGKRYKLNIQALKDLNKMVDRIDIEHLCTDTSHADIEILFIKEHCFLLTGLQVIALKELLQGTFAMLRLNHLITDCLDRLVVS